MSRVTENIRRSRGDNLRSGEQSDGTNELQYEAYVVTEGFPQMGFSLFSRSGERHVFFYHNIDNLDLKDIDDYQRLRFTHRGKAVTMRGRGMHTLIDHFVEHTLQAMYEFDPSIYPPIAVDDDVIERLEITDLNEIKKAMT